MENCEECYKIRCRECGWEPDKRELELIQKEILTKCPICSWSPSENLQK